MLRCLLIAVAITWLQTSPALENKTSGTESIERRYTDGTVSHYLMTGDNDGWHYTVQATDLVRRDASNRYYEEIGWSNFTSGQPLTPASLALRQTLSLDDPGSYMKVPHLAAVQPQLIGPITDLLTFYSDLLLAQQGKLAQAGETAYVSRTTPNSWADGERVLVGEDAVDFSLKVDAVNAAEHTVTLLVQHLPPPTVHVQLPALWMRTPASAVPNNFVQVSKQGDSFIAEAGKEVFDVRLVVDTRDGRLLVASMHNPVTFTRRTCADRALTHCGPPSPGTTLREVTWQLLS